MLQPHGLIAMSNIIHDDERLALIAEARRLIDKTRALTSSLVEFDEQDDCNAHHGHARRTSAQIIQFPLHRTRRRFS